MARKVPLKSVEAETVNAERLRVVNNSLKLRIDDLKTFDPLTDNQKLFFDAYKRGDYFVALHGVAGTGKAQPLDAKVLTPFGWTIMGSIEVGDQVVTPQGKISNVIGVFPQGEKDIFEIIFHDGSKTRACAEHLWEVWYPNNIGQKANKHIVNTNHLTDIIESGRSVSIDLITPFDVPDVDLPIDPYVLGVLLGDGGMTHHISITSADIEIIENVQQRLLPNTRISKRGDIEYALVQQVENKSQTSGTYTNPYKHQLYLLGLMGLKSVDKFIPNQYLNCSTNQKLELIRGLFDTDGTVGSKGSASFTTISNQLANNVQQILWSLGATCTITSRYPSYTYKDKKCIGALAYTLHVGYHSPKELFSLSRKRNIAREIHADGRVTLRRRVSSVELVSHEPAQCILIDDPDHLYVTDDYVVTHNTFCALYKALEEVMDKSNPFRKIIIVRSAVQSREIGHLPGDVHEKMEIYQQPYRQICETLFERKDAWDRLEEQGFIEFISTSFIRGMSFDDAIIIVDEMQNLTYEEIDTVMTRVGYRSKILWCGDYRQTDLNKKKNDMSGINKFFDIAYHMSAFTKIEFTPDDIVRSSLVKDYILAKLKYEDNVST